MVAVEATTTQNNMYCATSSEVTLKNANVSKLIQCIGNGIHAKYMCMDKCVMYQG